MAYLDEQAQTRELMRQQLLAGKSPFNLPGLDPHLEQLGLFKMAAPQGVNVDKPQPMQVPSYPRSRPGTAAPEKQQQDSSLGGILDGVLGKGSVLDQYMKRLQASRLPDPSQGAPGARLADRVRHGRAGPVPPAPTPPTPEQQIPGLQPAIDASKAPPGGPAAAAYMREQQPGPAVRGVEKGAVDTSPPDIKVAYGAGDQYGNAVPKPFTSIVTHWTGGDTLQSALATAKQGDPSRGGGRFGYHFLIDKDGSIHQAAPLEARTNHVKGPGASQRTLRPDITNSNAIGISTVGSGEPNAAQQAAAAKLIPHLQKQFNIPQDNIVGHGQIQAGDRHANEGQAIIKAARDNPPPPPGPEVPPMDTSRPAPAPAPMPESAAPIERMSSRERINLQPADTATRPATPMPASTAQPGSVLAQQRAPYAQQVQGNPALREKMAALMYAESGTDPTGRTGIAETMLNRGAATGQPSLDGIMNPRYYEPMQTGAYQKALTEIRNNPQLKAQIYAEQDKAFGGSNVTNLATDNGKTHADSTTRTFTAPNGELFSRKDVRPDVHGQGTVNAVKDWHAKTSGARGGQPAPQAAAPAAPQAEAPAPARVATADPAAVPTAAPAPAPPPQAPAPAPAPVTPAVAPAPPPAAAPPAPAPAPPPPPRPAPAPAAAPPSGTAAAHKLLDTKVNDLVRQFAPDQASQVPGFIGDKTLRQAIGTPLVGGQIKSGIAPHLEKLGVSPKDFDRAITEPPPAPGKRSEGTSDATDFSARARTTEGPPIEPGEAPRTAREGEAPAPEAAPQQQARPGELQMTPEIAKALEGAVTQEQAPSLAPTPPEALPVLPSEVAPPAPGAPGGAAPPPGGGAPGAMLQGGAGMPTIPGSQGGGIAMSGLSLAPLTTPLSEGAAAGTTVSPFQMWQPPVDFSTLQGWGWGGGAADSGAGFSAGGGFDFGGGGGGALGSLGSFGFFGGG